MFKSAYRKRYVPAAALVLPGRISTRIATFVYLTIIVLVPLSTLVVDSGNLAFHDFHHFLSLLASRRVLASFRVTFGTALIAAFINLFLGGILAYALVRVRLPFKRVVDALIDLPFAMPTAICGIALVTLYAPNGAIGSIAAKAGVKIAFTPLGIVLAMVFIGLPFVVRAVEPALQDVGTELEDAAMSLGASRFTAWRRAVVPVLAPSLLTGFVLAFARGLGEYGTIIFIAGNMPYKTEVTSLLIVTQLEQFDYPAATVVALAMLSVSLLLIFGVNWAFGRLFPRIAGKGAHA